MSCGMCYDIGWVLDCNDGDKPGPRMLEFIRCFHPECDVSSQPVMSVCFKGIEFDHVSYNPIDGTVMAVKDTHV